MTRFFYVLLFMFIYEIVVRSQRDWNKFQLKGYLISFHAPYLYMFLLFSPSHQQRAKESTQIQKKGSQNIVSFGGTWHMWMRARLLSSRSCESVCVCARLNVSGLMVWSVGMEISKKRLNLPQFIVIFEFTKMTMTGFTSFYAIFFIVCRFVIVVIRRIEEIKTKQKLRTKNVQTTAEKRPKKKQ